MNVSLTLESDPPGADAKTSLGPGCRTPCMLPVPADREFSVSYTLNGYLPQTVAVTPRQFDNVRPDIGSPPPSPEVTPNPVYAQLQPAPPPAPNRKRAPRPRAPKKQAPPPQ